MTFLILLVALAIPVLAPAAASAATKTTPYSRYTLAGSTAVAGAPHVNFRSYLLLPQKLRDQTANGGRVLRFGPIGSCKYNMSISAKVVARSGDETAAQRVARLQPAASQYIYAQGTRDTASWRVVRLTGTANVRSLWVAPASLATSVLFGSPTIPAWLEVRGTANEHTDVACHSGGPRYIGATLADAFGAMTGTAFATNLPRTTGPPAPTS